MVSMVCLPKRMTTRPFFPRMMVLLLLGPGMAGDLFERWVDHSLSPLDSTSMVVYFTYHVVNDFSDYAVPGTLIVHRDRIRFRYTLGPKTTLFDGTDWLLFDERTNQILIENRVRQPVMKIPEWMVPDSLKAVNRTSLGSPADFLLHIPEVSDSVTVRFSQTDSSLEKITFNYQLSEIRITDIRLGIPDPAVFWFMIDTTGKYILDLRE